jgi:hypothetical protein
MSEQINVELTKGEARALLAFQHLPWHSPKQESALDKLRVALVTEPTERTPLGGDCGYCGKPVDYPNPDCVGRFHPCPTCRQDFDKPTELCTDPFHRP